MSDRLFHQMFENNLSPRRGRAGGQTWEDVAGRQPGVTGQREAAAGHQGVDLGCRVGGAGTRGQADQGQAVPCLWQLRSLERGAGVPLPLSSPRWGSRN